MTARRRRFFNWKMVRMGIWGTLYHYLQFLWIRRLAAAHTSPKLLPICIIGFGLGDKSRTSMSFLWRKFPVNLEICVRIVSLKKKTQLMFSLVCAATSMVKRQRSVQNDQLGTNICVNHAINQATSAKLYLVQARISLRTVHAHVDNLILPPALHRWFGFNCKHFNDNLQRIQWRFNIREIVLCCSILCLAVLATAVNIFHRWRCRMNACWRVVKYDIVLNNYLWTSESEWIGMKLAHKQP